jgi:flagellar hook-basal body protein
LDSTQGALVPTNNDLDVAIEGPGYFAVQAPSGEVYTRGGSFRVSAQGQLITPAGDPVLGDSGPIRIAGTPVSISSDGTITARRASRVPVALTIRRPRAPRSMPQNPKCVRGCSKARMLTLSPA